MTVALPAATATGAFSRELMSACGAFHMSADGIRIEQYPSGTPSPSCVDCWESTARALYAAGQEHLRRKRVSVAHGRGFREQRDAALAALTDASADITTSAVLAHVGDGHASDRACCNDQACRFIRSARERVARAAFELRARIQYDPQQEGEEP